MLILKPKALKKTSCFKHLHLIRQDISTIMAETSIARRRSRTRPRSGDVLKPSGEYFQASLDLGGKDDIADSIGVVSHHTGSTQQSFTMSDGGSKSLTQTIPLEVVIVNDDEENIPSIRGHIVKEDVERRLQQFQTVISSYKNRLKSSEHLNNSLHKYLRQTQGYAENLLSERQELIDIINEMEKEDTRRVDQELLLKFIMCSSLFLYFFGGSHQFLVATVVLQLIVTAVNIIV